MGDTILIVGPTHCQVFELQQQLWRGWSHGKRDQGDELVCSVVGMENGNCRRGGKRRSGVGREESEDL